MRLGYQNDSGFFMKVATWMKAKCGNKLVMQFFLLLNISIYTLDEAEIWLLDVVT